jgi:hypothetical protein
MIEEELPSFITTAKNDLFIKVEADTLIHLPLKEHRQTFIILHGVDLRPKGMHLPCYLLQPQSTRPFKMRFHMPKSSFLLHLKADLQSSTKPHQKAPARCLYISGLIIGSFQTTTLFENSFLFPDCMQVALICISCSSKRFN